MVSFLSLILKVLSAFLATVQFEGTERERSWAQSEQTRLTKTGAVSNSTTLRLTGDTPPLLGERVDPYVPLERQVYGHISAALDTSMFIYKFNLSDFDSKISKIQDAWILVLVLHWLVCFAARRSLK